MNLQTLTDRFLNPEMIERLGWTLFHSLWLLFVPAVVLLLATRLLRNGTANMRYVTSCVCLLAMCCAVPLTFVLIQITPNVPQQIEPSVVSVEHNALDSQANAAESSLRLTAPIVFENHSPMTTETHVTELTTGDDGENQRIESANAALVTSPSAALPARFLQTIENSVAGWLNWIVAAWAIGVLVLSTRPFIAWRTIRRLKTRGVSEPSDKVFSVVQQTAEAIGIRRVVRVMQSTLVDVPAVVGWLQPVLLLPATAITGLTIDELKSIVAHELAHVRRNDYLVNILQTGVETLLFYHPAVWWVSHHIRTLREDCCDDFAVAMTNDRACYVRALLALDQRRSAQPLLALSADGGSLLNRVRRIVSGSDTTPKSAMSPSLAAVIAALVLLGGVRFWVPESTAFSNEPANVPAQIEAAEEDTTVTIPNDDVADKKTTGSLTGRIVFTGEPWAPALSKKTPDREVYDESVVLGPNNGLANVFVWLTTRDPKLKAAAKPPQPKTAQLAMQGGRFIPHALAFSTSDQLEVTNRDPQVGNLHSYPVRNQALNFIVQQGEKKLTSWKNAERFPFQVRSDFALWMKAYLLPVDHSWFAVTDKTGRFKIDNIPPGDWQVKIWHESCGYVKTDRFSGRFRHDVKVGINDFGDMKVTPQDLKRIKAKVTFNDAVKPKMPNAEKAPAAVGIPLKQQLEDDWFWFDPYSELGHVDRNGDGWRFVRLAGHEAASAEIGTTEAQQFACSNIYSFYNAGGPEKVRPRTPTEYVAHWAKARSACEPLLTAKQITRIDQIALQRMSYRAFSVDRVVKALQLTSEQRSKIKAAIQDHSKRLRPTKLQAEKPMDGRTSHKQVWLDIRGILTAEQIATFNKLRGAKPVAKHVRFVPHKLEMKDGQFVAVERGADDSMPAPDSNTASQSTHLEAKLEPKTPTTKTDSESKMMYRPELVKAGIVAGKLIPREVDYEAGQSQNEYRWDIQTDTGSAIRSGFLVYEKGSPQPIYYQQKKTPMSISGSKSVTLSVKRVGNAIQLADNLGNPSPGHQVTLADGHRLADQQVGFRTADLRTGELRVLWEGWISQGTTYEQRAQFVVGLFPLSWHSDFKSYLPGKTIVTNVHDKLDVTREDLLGEWEMYADSKIEKVKFKNTKDWELRDNVMITSSVPEDDLAKRTRIEFSIGNVHTGAVTAKMIGANGEQRMARLVGDMRSNLKNRQQVGTSMGKPVYRDQIRPVGFTLRGELMRLFVGPADKQFRRQNVKELTPSDEEVKLLAGDLIAKSQQQLIDLRNQLADDSLSKDKREQLEGHKQMLDSVPDDGMTVSAKFILENWKYQRLLYDKFGGGRILFQQAGVEAFDAMHNWLKQREAAGDFTVTDSKLRDELYAYWTTVNHGAFLMDDPTQIRTTFLEPEWLGQSAE